MENNENKKVLLSLKDVEVKFNVRGRILTAIRRVSLDIYENESIAIVGESGSGKSVLTKTFAGMLDSNGFISNGSIIFSDDSLSKTTVQIEVFNCPSGKRLLVYPSSAEVVLHCAFPISRDPSESFRLYVDYNEFASSINGRCIPRAVNLPPGVIDYKIIPEVFDCILSE